MSSIPDNFLGLDRALADYDAARFAVLPIPYDATTSYAGGARGGPRAIIAASQQVELYDETLGREAHRAGVATLDPLEPDSRGPEQMHERIYRAARRIVRDGKFLLGLGGEHGVSSALVRAVQTAHRDVGVLQIDAHADLRDSYQDSPYSHACVMRRIRELGVATVGVGVRNYSKPEATLIRKERIPIFSAERCHVDPGWIDDVVAALPPTVYVTIDIDGFDPAYAPGTGTPEPGGLDWYQVANLLAAVARARTIVAADIVEVRPIPPNHATEFLAAKLAYRLIGLTQRSRA